MTPACSNALMPPRSVGCLGFLKNLDCSSSPLELAVKVSHNSGEFACAAIDRTKKEKRLR